MIIGTVIAIKKEKVTIRIGTTTIEFEVEGHDVKNGDLLKIVGGENV